MHAVTFIVMISIFPLMSEYTFQIDKKKVGIELAVVAIIYAILFIITFVVGDLKLTIAINQLMVISPSWLQSLMYNYTKYGYDLFFGVVIVLALLTYFSPKFGKLKKYQIAMLGVIIGYCVSWFLTGIILKPLIARRRPFEDHPAEIAIYNDYRSEGFSFPSGHATAAFSMSGGFMARIKNWGGRILLYLYAISLSFTRPYFGEHYVTDILVGSILGLTCSIGFWVLFEHLNIKGKLSVNTQKILLILGVFVTLLSAVLDLLNFV